MLYKHLSKSEKDLLMDLQAFVNDNKHLPCSIDNQNLYQQMRVYVAKIKEAYDTKKTHEEILEEYLGIKLSNIYNISFKYKE